MKLERKGILLCLVGPAGSGKTYLGESLIAAEKGGIKYSVSVTTRPPRPNEIDGVHYHFVTRAEFERKIADNALFEWEEVHGNLYGTPLQTIKDAVAKGEDLLMDLDINGAFTMKRQFADSAVLVFLVPPNVDILLSRLRGREGTTEDELNKRLATTRAEYDAVKKSVADGSSLVDYLLVNDQIDDAFGTLSSIMRAERARMARFSEGAIAQLCSLE